MVLPESVDADDYDDDNINNAIAHMLADEIFLKEITKRISDKNPTVHVPAAIAKVKKACSKGGITERNGMKTGASDKVQIYLKCHKFQE